MCIHHVQSFDSDALSLEEFYSDFVSIGRPVIVRQAAMATAGAREELRRRWT